MGAVISGATFFSEDKEHLLFRYTLVIIGGHLKNIVPGPKKILSNKKWPCPSVGMMLKIHQLKFHQHLAVISTVGFLIHGMFNTWNL